METMFLAQIWGPILLAVGAGFFVSRQYYIKIYRDLEKAPLAVLTFGVLAMGVGLLQISVHNAWNTFPEIVISILGWGTMIKGLVFLVAPRVVDRSGDMVADFSLIPLIGIGVLACGGYLSYLGYLM